MFVFRTIFVLLLQSWAEGTEISPGLPVPTPASSPRLSTSPIKAVHLLQLMDLHWHITVTQSLYIRVHSCCCAFSRFGQGTTTCVHHYSTPLCPAYTFLLPQPCIFLLSLTSCHIAGIIQPTVFLDWFLSFSEVHFTPSPYVFLQLASLFLFSAE